MEWLTKAIGVVVLVTALGLLAAPRLVAYARGRRIEESVHFKDVQPSLTVAAAAVVGSCVDLTSGGEGALGSVMLLYLYPLRMTPHRLVATDIVHAIPLAVVAGTGYLFAGMVDWRMLASLLARKIEGWWVQLAPALVLIAAGVKVLM